MGTLLSKLHPQWAAHVVIDAQTGAILLSGATEVQFDDWHRRYPMWRAPGTVEEVRPDLRPAYVGADTCTHYLVCDSCLALETARGAS
jgi:hypothetical protein